MDIISFVIPVYNSEKTIETVVEKIDKSIMNLNNKYDYEIILVNDNSRDNSLEICKGICKKNSKVKLISLSRNFGQHSAIMAGYNHVNGNYVVSMDDDLQTDPKEVERMLSHLLHGSYDIVYAKYINKKHSFLRNLGSKLNNFMAYHMINKPKNINFTSFYIARRYVIDEVVNYKGPFPYMGGLLLTVTRNIANIEVEHKERKVGTSNYNFGKLVNLWINGFTNFSLKPIRIITFMGVFISCIAGFLLVLCMLNLIIEEISLGMSIQNIILLLFMGLVFISLGLIGEYVGRIFMLLNKSPQYIIKEQFNVERLYPKEIQLENKEFEKNRW